MYKDLNVNIMDRKCTLKASLRTIYGKTFFFEEVVNNRPGGVGG